MPSTQHLINAAWHARREGRHGDAERGLIEAINESRAAGSRVDLIHGLEALAHVVRDAGERERALPLSDEAVALCREEGDPLLLAHAIRHLGDLHRSAGRLEDAAGCYDEALALYRQSETPDPLDFANALRPAALLKEQQGDAAAARELWSKARTLYDAAGIQSAVDECARHLEKPAPR
jgi:tetratricopeptide (TPR) repeat protein